ncbi:MAG: apolipoprotein N-acyltransferase [Candidatus Omnitrophota bacterium]|nr:MAG: apolipoprotein N-acyltransferase [Candidatus Omnitrophota bacterium]
MKMKVILCLISGVLTGLSFNLPYFSYAGWVSLIPFIYVVNKSKLKEGIWAAIIFGLSFSGVAIFWLSKVTVLGLSLLLLYLSIYPALFFLSARFFFKRPLSLFTLPALWVILEFVRENVWVGFGWLNLGYSQYRNIYLIQVADLFGVKLISFLMVMVNVLIWEIFFKKKYVLVKTAVVLIILSSSIGYSIYRLDSIRTTDYVDVSVVQPNIRQELKWDESAKQYIIDKLKDLGKKTKEDSLVIFPEASYPYNFGPYNLDEVDMIVQNFIKELGRDIIIGAIKEFDGRFYNVAFKFDKNSVLFKDDYSKMKLVPFGEYVPLRKILGFINVINSIGDMTPGRSYTKFPYKDKSFSVLICFEDVLPLHVRRFSQKKDFLVNITNDAWFGGHPEARQHLGIMVFRAIENRIPIVRCANTGISGWVSATGRIEKLESNGKDVFFSGVGDFRVALSNEKSLYKFFGEFFPIICGLILLGIVVFKK